MEKQMLTDNNEKTERNYNIYYCFSRMPIPTIQADDCLVCDSPLAYLINSTGAELAICIEINIIAQHSIVRSQNMFILLFVHHLNISLSHANFSIVFFFSFHFFHLIKQLLLMPAAKLATNIFIYRCKSIHTFQNYS